MNYFFVRRYNPAYDFSIIKHFRGGGIEFDENLTFRQAERLSLKSDETPHEKLFRDYVRSWGYHPEVRPSYYSFFARAVADEAKAGIKKLIELEPQLPKGLEKLIFTDREVATEVSNFYNRYLSGPLRRDIGNGVVDEDLMRYFSKEELNHFPREGKVDREIIHEVVRKVTIELLGWLEQISPEKVLQDMERAFETHSVLPGHMQLDLNLLRDKNERMGDCLHESEYVELNFYHGVDDDITSRFLKPSRGRSLIEEGWEFILFPWYYVFEESED